VPELTQGDNPRTILCSTAVPSFSGVNLSAAQIHTAMHREASTEGQRLKATDQLPPVACQVSYSTFLPFPSHKIASLLQNTSPTTWERRAIALMADPPYHQLLSLSCW